MLASDLEDIQKKIGYRFDNILLLEQAFVHSSYAKRAGIADNERMEFLGDAVLGSIVSEYLYDRYPQFDAGMLSKARACLVSAEGLRPIVDGLDILQYLQVADKTISLKKLSKKIEANLFEAILCAVYLDGGMPAAKELVLRLLQNSLENVGSIRRKDYKTLLQEHCQSKKLSIEYRLVDKSGPDNKPQYRYALYVDGKHVSEGIGSSIKSAEQDAARIIVEEWRID